MRARIVGAVVLTVVGIIAITVWLAGRSTPGTPPRGVVVVDAAAPIAPLAAPAPPTVANAVAAAPDAFVGSWRSRDGALLAIARTADRYEVNLTIDGITDAYDGVLRDGRVQIARGIDGEWIQLLAGSGPPCLQLAGTQEFCRS